MKRSNHGRRRKPDNQHKLRMESLENRLCLAASLGWDGPGQGATSLNYYIGEVPANVGLEQAEVEAAIETALDAWSDVADVTFTQTTLARQSDSLDITFRSIDGSGGILAQAYLPDDVNRGRLAGDIEFDLADPWEIGNAVGRAAFDFVYVAVHEIGHALGLDHLNVVGSVMRPSVSPNQVFSTLAPADVNEILGVYAAAPSDTTDTGSTDTGGSTDNLDQGGNATDDGSPSDDNTSSDEDQPRRRGWRGRFSGFGRWHGRIGRATVEVLTFAPTHHNSERPSDVNDDQTVSALDALMIINDLNKYGPRSLSFGEGEVGSSFSMVDVNGDENVTALDALMVVNELNRSAPVSIASEESVDEEMITDENTTTDEEVSTESTDTTTEEDLIDDTSAETNDADETESEEEVDDTGAEDEDTEDESAEEEDSNSQTEGEIEEESEEESDNDDVSSETETEEESDEMIDDGPLEEEDDASEEEHEGCHRGCRDLIARFDANEDGLLTVDEVPEMLWDKLLVGDTDEDGAISPAELEAIALEHHRRDPIARFDANEDGALTVEEVPERLWERLLQADADGDGAVTGEELAEARASASDDHPHHRRHRRHRDR